MVRIAVLFGLLVMLIAPAAEAGQSSASFTVGITITGAAKSPTLLKKRKLEAAAIGAETPTVRHKTFTWRAAAISVRRAGYFYPEFGHRDGNLYWFTAYRGGTIYHVAVSARTGQVLKVIST